MSEDNTEKQIIGKGIDGNITALVPTKPDAEVAKELKEETIAAWQSVLCLMEKAHKSGFRVNVNAGMNELGQAFIHTMEISKVYK